MKFGSKQLTVNTNLLFVTLYLWFTIIIRNYTDYKSRFSMPGGHDSLYYSIDIGPAHIIMFSTEVYIRFETLERDLVKQYNWLEEDLKVLYQYSWLS